MLRSILVVSWSFQMFRFPIATSTATISMLTLRLRLYMYPRPLAFTSAIVIQGQSNTDHNDSNPCDWSEKAGHAGFSGISRLRPQKRHAIAL
jgi:hypothetical protein